jgi:hypothetical protein
MCGDQLDKTHTQVRCTELLQGTLLLRMEYGERVSSALAYALTVETAVALAAPRCARFRMRINGASAN